MKSIAGVLRSGEEARKLVHELRASGLPEDKLVLLEQNHARRAGSIFEDLVSQGIPGDELCVYVDALRQGRTVLIALADDERSAGTIRGLMEQEGVESIDAARDRWWVGLREGEREHYATSGRDFQRDEHFYRLGFQSALHASTRGKEYDQVLSEMARELEELETRYPAAEVEEPFRRGYERGTAYFESIRGKA